LKKRNEIYIEQHSKVRYLYWIVDILSAAEFFCRHDKIYVTTKDTMTQWVRIQVTTALVMVVWHVFFVHSWIQPYQFLASDCQKCVQCRQSQPEIAKMIPTFQPSTIRPLSNMLRSTVPNLSAVYTTTTAFDNTVTTQLDRDKLLAELWTLARKHGQKGVLAPQVDQDRLQTLAKSLAAYSPIPDPAKYRLEGTFELVYCNSPNASSGKIIGPIYGYVTQSFGDDDDDDDDEWKNDGVHYVNKVEIGVSLLQISLRARYQALNENVNRVDFETFTVKIAGQTVLSKNLENAGGTWEYCFLGEVNEPGSNDVKLLRIMNTPSLFILAQSIKTRRP
jgi:hypothetical protein